jgi:hypothetical protein
MRDVKIILKIVLKNTIASTAATSIKSDFFENIPGPVFILFILPITLP